MPLLQPFPWGDAQTQALRLRGRILFGVGARLLGAEASHAEAEGALWSLVDGAYHCSDAGSRAFLLGEARSAFAELGGPLPRGLRPLTVLAALAAADLVREGSGLKRLSAALRHRLLGTFIHS
ncbi:MAG: hypothetical protein ACJ8FT_00245 [Sphingomonas sp.]